MTTKVFVEVLDRHGHVVQRHAIEQLPCALGRAYDNQVVLDDPFVEPHHAVVQARADGSLELCEQASGKRQRIDDALGLECRLGRAKVRLRTPGFRVPATRPDPLIGTWLGRFAAHRPLMRLTLALGVLAFACEVHLANTESDSVREFTAALGVLGMLAMWAGAFDLAGRLRGHEKNALAHFGLAAGGLIPLVLLARLFSYGQMIAPHRAWAIVSVILFAALLGVWTALHALLTGVPFVRRAAISGALTTAAVLAVLVGARAVRETRYEEELDLDVTIEPVPTSLLVTTSAKAFLARSKQLRDEVDAARERP